MKHVPYQDRMQIALEAQVCLNSVNKRLQGETIRGRAGERLEEALRSRGIRARRRSNVPALSSESDPPEAA